MSQSYDVIIIGAGTAGLSALREVRRFDANFLLINSGPYGTTCARVGCMPSKALIEAANAYTDAKRLGAMGIRGSAELTADVTAVLQYVRSLRDHYVEGVLRQTQALGDRSITGHARFLGPNTLDVEGRQYEARSIVIATGSRPVLPEKWKAPGGRIITSDELFEQKSLPRRLAVIGMGANGLEMAQALARLGINVYGFEASEFVGGLTDPVVSERATNLLREEFVLYRGMPADICVSVDGVTVETGGEEIEVDKVLVALGRRPNLDGLNLESLGLELDDAGMPPFDPATTQVGDLRVFIAGDVNGYAPVLHEGADEGRVAGFNAVRDRVEAFERRAPLVVCFCAPNIAQVGRAFATVCEIEPVIGEVDFSGQGRALMRGRDHGCLRVYVGPDNGRILGAEMCAPEGEHLAHLLAWSIQQQLTVFDILELPFYHPTVEEAIRTAVRDAAGKYGATHKLPELALCDRLPVEGLD